MRAPLRTLALAACALGAVLGLALTYTPAAGAARNSSGSYSLPSGNPVVSGTAITASWANNTLSDISTELTNSLDRQGRGAMLAPLQLASGSSSAPSLTFSSEASSGLYRAGAGDVRLQVSATNAQKWTASGVTFPLAATLQGGATATTTATNGAALTATGSGTGAGLVSTGGASSGAGLQATGGAPNGAGGSLTGTGSGNGLNATGGATNGIGGNFTGGGSLGAGVVATGGTGGGVGLVAANGVAATAGARQSAASLSNGDLSLSGVTNPSAGTAVAKTLTPKNLVHVWARVAVNGAGGATVTDGFNVSGASVSGGILTVTFASAFASAVYACLPSVEGNWGAYATSLATGSVGVRAYDPSSLAAINLNITAATINVVCLGAQ